MSGTVRGDELWFGYNAATGGSGGLARLADGEWTNFPAPVRSFLRRDRNGALIYSTRDGLCIVPPGSEPLIFLTVPNATQILSATLGRNSDVWVGMGEEALRFRPDRVPPQTIASVPDTLISAGQDVRVDVVGVERFKPRDSAGKFRVSLLRDGEWTPFELLGRDGILLEDLAAGAHNVFVRVQDEGLDIDPTPAALRFRVHALPLQQRAWFWSAVGATFLIIAVLATTALAAKRRLTTQAASLSETVKLRTNELQTSERKYRNLFEQSHDAVFLVDVDGRITDANHTTLELIGFSFGDVLGKYPASMFFYDDDYVALQKDLSDGVPVRDQACRIRTRGGKTLFTAARGRCLGLVHGGASRKNAALREPGAQLSLTWRGRLEGQLGSFRAEPIKSRAGPVFDDPLALAGLSAVCALLSAFLPEREPQPTLYGPTVALLDEIAAPETWPGLYAAWELAFLETLGYGLDLSSCAATGSTQELIYVSPRSGRAVSRAAGEPYAEKLLALPTPLRLGGPCAPADFAASLALTGRFIGAWAAPAIGLEGPPAARLRLQRLAEAAATAG